MRLLEERILRDGHVRAGGVLKVDGFLNHQMDVELFAQLAEQWHEAFAADNVNKILTKHRRLGLHHQGGELHPRPRL